jgi:hypothetical protein
MTGGIFLGGYLMGEIVRDAFLPIHSRQFVVNVRIFCFVFDSEAVSS